MNIVDIVLITILILAAIAGYKRGVIREAASFVGIIFIFVIAFSFKESLGNSLCKFAPFFNFSGNIKGLVTLNILLYQLIAFLLIFMALFGIFQLVLKLTNVLQKAIDFTVVFAVPSSVLGSIVSIFSCYIFLFAALLVLLVPFNNEKQIKKSFMVQTIVYETPVLSTYSEKIIKTIENIKDLTNGIVKSEISTNTANLEIAETMLKYKIVDKKTIEQLIVLDKLKGVEGLDKVLKNY